MLSRSSSPSLRYLAATTTTTDAAAMSSRSPYRGGRSGGQNQWRRGFSGRGDDERGQFVTGDSHFRSVRDANRGFRPVERSNFANPSRGPFERQPWRPFNPRHRPSFNAPPPYNGPPPFNPRPRPSFNTPPPYNGPPPFNSGQLFTSLPPFNQSQPFRPRPQKPLDFRHWEFAKPGPPSDSERFTVLSYNILADYLAINHRNKLYFHIPRHMLDWEWRKKNIIFELGLWSADILCFQEVDRFQDLEEELKFRGYTGIWKMRTGDPVDGCAIFWRVSRFKLLLEECIEFNKLGLRDNVAQICVLESLNRKNSKDTAIPMSLQGFNKVVICNIHVLYNPKRGEIKLGQIRVLLDRAHAVSKLWDDAPIILCGDFNCTPKSSLYNFISEQKLDLSGLPRDKVSGQASAEIWPPRVSRVVGQGEVRQNSPIFDAQKQNANSKSGNVPVVNSLSEVDSGLSVSNDSSIVRQYDYKNDESSNELTKEAHLGVDYTAEAESAGLKETPNKSQNNDKPRKDGHESVADSCHGNINSGLVEMEPTEETHQVAVDNCKDEILSTLFSGIKESLSSPQSEGELTVSERNDGQSFTTVDSCHKDIYSKSTETEHGKEQLATTDVHNDSSNECFLANIRTYNESTGGSTDAIMDPSTADAPDLDISSSESLPEICSVSPQEVSTIEDSENLSSLSADEDKEIPSISDVNAAYESRSTSFMLDEKMENFSFNELLETNEEDRTFGEESSKFLSELHYNNDSSAEFSHTVFPDLVISDKSFQGSAFVPRSQQLHDPGDEILDDVTPTMDAEPVDEIKFTYDPSAWTPKEIETATGKADCTLMEHPLKLSSTYAEVEDCSGTRDSNGEPLVTSYNRCFLGTVDYIWRSEGLQTVRILAPMPKHAMQWTPGFPTKKWGSDHIALVSELAFRNDVSTQNEGTP
ncbi:carbon catabolite repressor protein 4 homolog 6 isoform X2 [Diospyros lotus]|uniref:carbon catabolite repressor protein 4 homolog 6 isoform X2 n=1 Tax=Diospyros lotus TaxID=55363 RepID=UPI00224E90B1|nr:carbon catabolite repressor protein 4 homolog 6 isoform X2 [Diospyros lotus]